MRFMSTQHSSDFAARAPSPERPAPESAAYSGLGTLGDSACRAAFEALQGYLLVADAQRRIQFLSRAKPGFSLRRFIGTDFVDLVAEEHRPLLRQAADRILAGGPLIELEAKGADTGRWHLVRIVGIEDRGAVGGFAIHGLDIDDAKRKETETAILRSRFQSQLRASSTGSAEAEDVQRRFDLMADALPVLISYVDRERSYQYNNSAYERWFGQSREELKNRRLDAVLGTAAYERIRPYVDAALEGRSVTFEIPLPYKSAGLRQVVAHYVPDFGARGDILGFFALIEDVTKARDDESTLRQRDDEIRQLQKMEALGRLAGGMAHEFNNLLHVVLTSCGAVLPMLEDSPAAAQIAQMERAAARGASLTRQLLSFNRSTEIRPVPLDLDPLLADVAVLLERLLGAQVALEVNMKARARILADAGQLQQILMNLAINARDAMPRGGRLTLGTARVRVGDGDGSAHPALKPGEYVLLTVTDTGTGMDPETLARIFDPFFTTKPPEQGTGLGLSTVYGLLKQLGADIDVDSAPGRGTTFRLYFPCLGPDERATPAAASGSS